MSDHSRKSSFEEDDLKDSIEHVESMNVQNLDTIESTRCSKYAWLVSITAGVGGFLFGYDTGIISSILVVLNDDLGQSLNSSTKELITSITSGGAFVGGVVAGLCADRYGRKLGIYNGCILFIIGAIIQATSFSIAQMTVGRLIVGLGVGSAAMIVPLYIAEVAPAKYRGRMISLDNLSITTGQLISYGIGAAFASVSAGWRYMAAIGAVPAIILCALLPFCPESPRQLVYHHKPDEAAKVIAKIFPDGAPLQVQQKVQHITIHVDQTRNEDKSLWWQIKQLYVVPANFRAMFAACGLMAISQLGGFNSILYYSGTLFAAVGFDKPIAVGTIIAATNFIFTWINLLLVDRVGRRQILLHTLWVMAAALAVAAISFHWIPLNHNLELTSHKNGWAADIVLVCMVVFVAFYSAGAGNIAWMSSEFYPLEVRAVGTMMLTMSCWGSNVIVSSTFLTQMANTTPSGAFGFYAAVCFFGWIGVIFCYPDVKGMTLEDIREVFQHGFGVKYARDLQREAKQSRNAARENVGVAREV
ncbi:uncharacterized protein N7496_003565 [Penicillium cataractarum]|uniref:Major facilitator superfamily (MFS) profile domain-containing protein n=1 Tax=Penicillium cataractarum TaxID=2100454 RepID=A0A9W9SMP9_9EURO|nr:uncharacterized protein N7496_003565 [Penicillium cataractarum]KAJ5381137.1 hypothetical protein N7496_003565 [Penicillium cataractarum]